MRWERVWGRGRPEGRKGTVGPGRRWGHTCNAVSGGRFIYVFAGYGGDNAQTNDVHVFDSHNQTWSRPIIKGLPPSPRDSHSCTTVGSKLFVFGGTDGRTPLKDLHILDTSSNTWIQPALQGDGPDAREGHSATLVGTRLFIFGGCGKSMDYPDEVYYNDLYILHTDSLVWERAVTSGIPPSPRDSHTCSSRKNKIIVLGGEDSTDCYLSDVHILDADTLSWRQINTSGQMLAPRAGHTTVAVGNRLFVFGGFTDDRNLYDDLHVLNLDTGFWSRVTKLNEGPCARFSVAGDCLDEQNGIIVFMGGCNENLEALDDMYYLHTEDPIDNDVKTARKRSFEARIMHTNDFGYEIETFIEGKLLRGMIFSYTVMPIQENKRRTGTDFEHMDLNQASVDVMNVISEEAKNKDQRHMGIVKCSSLEQPQLIAKASKDVDEEAKSSDQRKMNMEVSASLNLRQETSLTNSMDQVPEIDCYEQNKKSGISEPSSLTDMKVTSGGSLNGLPDQEPRNHGDTTATSNTVLSI